MTKTRRLSDLYVRGVEVPIGDDQWVLDENGEKVQLPPVTVWLQKLNPADHEIALRSAGARRAIYMSVRNQHDSDEYLAVVDQVSQMSHDQKVAFVINEELVKLLISTEARLAAEEEWENDNYLQGLRDAWPKMEIVLESDLENVEALRVRDELKRFNDQVDKALEAPRDDLTESYGERSEEELQELAADRMIVLNADFEWHREFRKAQIWLATRTIEDHKQRYFESREEVDELHLPVLKRLQDEYTSISVDPIEGKDLQAIPSSSPSVEQPKTEETEISSGQLVAVQ